MWIPSAIRIRAARVPLAATALVLSCAVHGALLAAFALLPAGNNDMVTRSATVQFKLGRPIESVESVQQSPAPQPVERDLAPEDTAAKKHIEPKSQAHADAATELNQTGKINPAHFVPQIELPRAARNQSDDPAKQSIEREAISQASVDALMNRVRAFASALPTTHESQKTAARDERAAAAPESKPKSMPAHSTSDPESHRSTAAPRGIDRGADIVDLPAPTYPRRSVRLGQEGTAIVAVEVLSSSAVGEVRLLQSSGHKLLDNAAREAARNGSYRAALVNGESSPATLEIPFEFRLREGQ